MKITFARLLLLVSHSVFFIAAPIANAALGGFVADGTFKEGQVNRWPPPTGCERVTLALIANKATVPLNPLRAFNEIVKKLQNRETTPPRALGDLLRIFNAQGQFFNANYPAATRMFNALSLNVPKDFMTYMSRFNDITFGAIIDDSNTGIALKNSGVVEYLYDSLRFDPALAAIAAEFLRTLAPLDTSFRAKVTEKRKTEQVDRLRSQDWQDKGTATDIGVSEAALRTEHFPDFDPVKILIQITSDTLKKKDALTAPDPDQVKQYVFKALLMFHDDIDQLKNNAEWTIPDVLPDNVGSEHAKNLGAIRSLMPTRVSLMYTDWLETYAPFAKTDRSENFEYLSKLEEKLVKFEIPRTVARARTRIANYHYMAPAAMSGLSSHGLFKYFPFKNILLKFLHAQAATNYRKISMTGLRQGGNSKEAGYQNAVFEYIKAKYPERLAPFLSGVDGKLAPFRKKDAVGDDNIYDFLLDKIESDPKFIDELKSFLSEDRSVSSNDPKFKDNVKIAIVLEQIYRFHAWRTVEQHREASTVADNIRKLIDSSMR